MVEGVHVPAERVHGAHDLVQVPVVEQRPREVVSRLGEVVAVLVGHDPLALAAHDVDLALDAEVEREPELGRALDLLVEDGAGAHRPGLFVIFEIARTPGDLRLPGELGDGGGIGIDRELVVVGALAEAVERRAREELRAPHHPFEVLDRHGLALGDTVHVDIGREAVLDALAAQLLLDDAE